MEIKFGRVVILVEDYDKAFDFTKRISSVKSFLILQWRMGKGIFTLHLRVMIMWVFGL